MNILIQRLYVRIAGVVVSFLASVEVSLAQGTTVIQNPLGGTSTICGFIKNILNVALAVAVPFLVLFIIYGGFLLVYARGNSEKLRTAKRNLLAALLGTIVILGAWTLGQVIANTINSIQQSSGTGAGTANFAQCN